MVALRALALPLLLLVACAQETISREEWQRMPSEDRLLYVRSLVGEQKAKDAKGGRGTAYDRPAEEYVTAIDQAYARGDAREVHRIFEDLR